MGQQPSTTPALQMKAGDPPQTDTQRHTPRTLQPLPPKQSRSQTAEQLSPKKSRLHSLSESKPPSPYTTTLPPKTRVKSASTTTVPTYYHVQTDRKLEDIEKEHKKLLEKHVQLQTETQKQQTLQETRIKTLEAQLQHLSIHKQRIDAQNRTIQSLNNELSSTQDTIRSIKDDLSTAQQTILSMTSIVDVNQKMPTVDELLVKFQSIRDQQHADICSTLKKSIKKQHPKWHKYYIAQLVHKVTFNGLIMAYNAIKEYKARLYHKIADELNMKYTIYKWMDDGKNVGDIDGEINRILSNMFGAYFKNNYDSILKKDKVINVVLEGLIHIYKEIELNEWSESDTQNIRLYIAHCCDICWVMMLQDPMLDFYPTQWEPKETVVYNDEIHKKVLGSDRKTDKVLYYVWPAISRAKDICGNYKIDVLIKDAFYTKIKDKKKKVVHQNEKKEETDVALDDGASDHDEVVEEVKMTSDNKEETNIVSEEIEAIKEVEKKENVNKDALEESVDPVDDAAANHSVNVNDDKVVEEVKLSLDNKEETNIVSSADIEAIKDIEAINKDPN